MLLGETFTKPAVIEIECLEEVLSMIDGAEMVKFAKNGSDRLRTCLVFEPQLLSCSAARKSGQRWRPPAGVLS